METKAVSAASQIVRHAAIFACPQCGGDIDFAKVSCIRCDIAYGEENGIPLFFRPNEWDGKSDVTESMKAFYEKTPFPNYDDIDSGMRLAEKAEKGLFAHLLNKQMRFGVRVLEAGCGTGQLSNFLGLTAGRAIFGADMCMNSLRLADGFRAK